MKTETELVHDRIRAHATALFGAVVAPFLYRVSLPGEDFPELEIPAEHELQAKARFDAVCNIRWTNKPHRVEVVRQNPAPTADAPPAPLETVALMESPKHEPQRRGRNGSSAPGGR